MRTVQSIYTVCIGSEDLPWNTQGLYRLIARLAGIAEGGVDPVTLVINQTELVRN